MKPGNTVPLFSYTPGATNLKFSTIASAFTREAWDIQQESENNNWNEKINQVDGHGVKIKYTDLQGDRLSHGVQVLDASATLSRHWRMSFSKAGQGPTTKQFVFDHSIDFKWEPEPTPALPIIPLRS